MPFFLFEIKAYICTDIFETDYFKRMPKTILTFKVLLVCLTSSGYTAFAQERNHSSSEKRKPKNRNQGIYWTSSCWIPRFSLF